MAPLAARNPDVLVYKENCCGLCSSGFVLFFWGIDLNLNLDKDVNTNSNFCPVLYILRVKQRSL